MNLPTEPFIGITVLYADDLEIFEDFDWGAYSVDQEVSEIDYFVIPMSQRIEWAENLAKEGNAGAKIFVVTNEYNLLNLLEHASEKGKFRIYHGDTDVVVDTFVALKPNPTLAIGEYIFGKSVKRALKGG